MQLLQHKSHPCAGRKHWHDAYTRTSSILRPSLGQHKQATVVLACLELHSALKANLITFSFLRS